jgi:hypothetical protein
MKHYIYSVHSCSGSKWSKGYSEFYFTDIKQPTGANPVMSVIVLQIGDTEEKFIPNTDSYAPAVEVPVRICRATYNKLPQYGMKEQKCYLFNLVKYDIRFLIGMCEDNIDDFLVGKEEMDVNDPKYVNWGYQVPP